MQTLPVGELKTHFSEVLTRVQHGEEFVVSYGRKKEKIAVIIPYAHYKGTPQQKRVLGALEGKASFSIADDFKITTTDFLGIE